MMNGKKIFISYAKSARVDLGINACRIKRILDSKLDRKINVLLDQIYEIPAKSWATESISRFLLFKKPLKEVIRESLGIASDSYQGHINQLYSTTLNSKIDYKLAVNFLSSRQYTILDSYISDVVKAAIKLIKKPHLSRETIRRKVRDRTLKRVERDIGKDRIKNLVSAFIKRHRSNTRTDYFSTPISIFHQLLSHYGQFSDTRKFTTLKINPKFERNFLGNESRTNETRQPAPLLPSLGARHEVCSTL